MKRVLVIEDEGYVARLVTLALEMRGVPAVVDHVADGGLGKIKAASGSYDLITLDIAMPLMDGVEALSAIKADPRSKDTPVVIITGVQDVGLEGKVRAMGAAEFIMKPFGVEDLGETLGRVLDNSAEPDAPAPWRAGLAADMKRIGMPIRIIDGPPAKV